jgi:hypothetical protein
VIRRSRHAAWAATALLLLLPMQTGCAAIGLTVLGTALGVGGGTATSYALNGYAYRTFALPLPTVERGTRQALERMGIKVEGREPTEEGALLHATANQRTVEVRLERVTSKTTRIRTVVHINALLMDRATAQEIIVQTEDILGRTTIASQ